MVKDNMVECTCGYCFYKASWFIGREVQCPMCGNMLNVRRD